MKVPTNAPTIPRRIVMMMPPGSLPGITNFASAPTMSPMMMVQRIDMWPRTAWKGLYDAETRSNDRPEPLHRLQPHGVPGCSDALGDSRSVNGAVPSFEPQPYAETVPTRSTHRPRSFLPNVRP